MDGPTREPHQDSVLLSRHTQRKPIQTHKYVPQTTETATRTIVFWDIHPNVVPLLIAKPRPS